MKNKRKTLSAGDVFSALEDMEFEEFIPELKDCLEGSNRPKRVEVIDVHVVIKKYSKCHM